MNHQDRKRFFHTHSGVAISTLTFLLLFLPVFATLSHYGVTWDEPVYMEATNQITSWLALDSERMFTQSEIDRYWKTDPKRNVHPSGLKWFYLLARKAVFWEDNPSTQNAILNILLFSISLTLFLRWWMGDSFFFSFVFVILLLTIPRFFAHLHFPATDIPMVTFLLAFIVALDKTILTRSFWIPGFLLGFFASIKLTSVILAIPMLVLLLVRYRAQWRVVLPRLLFICVASLLIYYIINPDYWFDPIERGKEFLQQSLTRREWVPINLLFNGRIYQFRGPFHYPFTMFFITTPLAHILLMFIGIGLFFQKRELRNDYKSVYLFTYLCFPFFLLMLPTSPAHDGIRYLLPAFPFAVCFMTLGAEKVWRLLRMTVHSAYAYLSKWIMIVLLALLIAGDMCTPARFPPFELSFYNLAVGGLSGADKKGFETTYWWEILNNEALFFLNQICRGRSVCFLPPPLDFYMKNLHERGATFQPVWDPFQSHFMLFLGRPNVQYWEQVTGPQLEKVGRTIKPIWSLTIDSVPLLRLYQIRELEKDR